MPNTFLGTPLPTFPSTWYHPIYGARQIDTYEDFQKLDQDWRATAAEADKDRTETEAAVVMNHNQQVKREMVLSAASAGEKLAGASPPGKEGEEGEQREKFRPGQQPTDGRSGHSEFAFSRDSGNEANKAIVRNSVQAQESLNKGYPEPL
jgi:hypothetical protein